MSKLIFAMLFAALAFAARKPITHESMWLLKRVGAPSPSPDGKWVVFPVTQPAYDPKEQSTDLWLVPGDGSAPPRQITFTRAMESSPVWSPDGRRLAFTATREGDNEAQLYVLDVLGGGEAQRYTQIATGVSDPRWSPDGRRILFTSMVAAGEAPKTKSNARVFESFPVRMWDHWLDNRRAHLFVMESSPGAAPNDILAGTQWASTPGMGAPLANSGEDFTAVWTPDSRSIVFASDINRHEAAHAFVKTKLFLISASGGEPRPLTSGAYSYSSPRFRPDGKALYAIESREGVNNATYSLNRLALIPWPQAGLPRTVTENIDRSVESFVLTPDSKSIFFAADQGGLGRLQMIPAEGGALAEHPQTEGNYANLAGGGNLLFANYDSATSPAEIYRFDPILKQMRAITSFNAATLAELDLSAPRHFYFTSKKGRLIHNLLITPPGFDETKRYPLFVLIHGGPHGMWKDQFFLRWNYHLIASPGYVVLLTNYTGSTGFGEKFAQAIQGDPLATPGDELNEAADEALRLFSFIDPARQAAGGASYGGHLANWLQATTARYKCLVSHAGLINLESQWGTSDSIYHREINSGGPIWQQGETWRKQNPIRYAAQFKTPALVTVGERDFRVPLNNSLEYWSVLQRLRIPSKLIVFPDANHWILKAEDSRFFYSELLDWLQRWLR
ncbi:MAG: prolyl oligopeptidase family serine peptidase [Acidobacteriota bacterium]|jgi:dipeptidyl aminopeptidase/acylaminoacyl peptidase